MSVLLFDAFSNHCLANAVEPLRAANMLVGRRLYRWHFASLTGEAVTSSSGLPVQPDLALSDDPGGDYLFVMPSYGFERAADAACGRALRAASRRFSNVVAMDTGAWLLAAAGLLDGRRATIHWDEIDRFAERFPETTVVPDRIVRDGAFLSCGGANTAFDLVLDLIAAHHGAMVRLEVASLFMPDPERTSGPGGSAQDKLISLMRRNIEFPLPVAELAARLGQSQKALERACKRRYGIGPRRIYLGLRLGEARRLLTNTRLSVEEVATRCGYGNASAMTRAFGREFGLSPRALRAAGPGLRP
ncbi:MAG: GlxA family transcriptional regulator [Marinibacterium sp.]